MWLCQQWVGQPQESILTLVLPSIESSYQDWLCQGCGPVSHNAWCQYRSYCAGYLRWSIDATSRWANAVFVLGVVLQPWVILHGSRVLQEHLAIIHPWCTG